MDGNRAIAKILKAEGVEWVACFPEQKLIDAVAKEGIRPILCRQERAGVNMADGFSRIMNGRSIGVFTMQVGPGAENAFSGVAQAYADSVPMLALPGGIERNKYGVHPNFDAVPNYSCITKWAANINLVSRIPELMRYAFSQLSHGRLGPVLVEIPGDVGTEEYTSPQIDYQPVQRHVSAGSTEDVRDLVKALLSASNPVINAGQGVMYAEATDELVRFAELTNIPVTTTLAGKSAFPENHRLSLGVAANSLTQMAQHFLEKTDLILGLGSSLTMSTFNAQIPEGVLTAQVTNCADDLNKQYGPSYGAVGDAKIVLEQMIEEAKRQLGEQGRGDVNGVVDEIAKVREVWMEQWSPLLTSDEVPINPYRVFTELANSVNVADTIVTHDSGYPRDQLVPFWNTVKPRGYIGWGKSTQLGYGLGLAIGAKLAAPEKHVINFMGDAAFGMAGLDIETAVRSEIPILTIILNNSIMTHYSSHMPYATDQWKLNELSGDYAKVAEGLGAHSEKVTAPDQIASAIKRSLQANSEGQPAVIEVITKEEERVSKF
tara:strand:- start:5 stop:1642 length:1638 start_codon:yes stop_codon:yes gene_type:complete